MRDGKRRQMIKKKEEAEGAKAPIGVRLAECSRPIAVRRPYADAGVQRGTLGTERMRFIREVNQNAMWISSHTA